MVPGQVDHGDPVRDVAAMKNADVSLVYRYRSERDANMLYLLKRLLIIGMHSVHLNALSFQADEQAIFVFPSLPQAFFDLLIKARPR